MKIKGRLAPTPSGYIHKGNALNFLLTYILVKLDGGLLLLRIDDIDDSRFRNQFLENIFQSLDLLKIEWDAGPLNTSDFYSNFRQSNKNDLYWDWFNRIPQEFLYACSCSRKDLKEFLIYPGNCKQKHHQPIQKKINIRMKTNPVVFQFNRGIKVDLAHECGDFILWRKEGKASYHLMSLVEDNLWGTNLVVRGEDLIQSSAVQIYAESKMNRHALKNSEYIHHPLLYGANNLKLSKSTTGNDKKNFNWTRQEIIDELAMMIDSSIKKKGVSYLELEDLIREKKKLLISKCTEL